MQKRCRSVRDISCAPLSERLFVGRGFDFAQGVVTQLFERMHETLKR